MPRKINKGPAFGHRLICRFGAGARLFAKVGGLMKNFALASAAAALSVIMLSAAAPAAPIIPSAPAAGNSLVSHVQWRRGGGWHRRGWHRGGWHRGWRRGGWYGRRGWRRGWYGPGIGVAVGSCVAVRRSCAWRWGWGGPNFRRCAWRRGC